MQRAVLFLVLVLTSAGANSIKVQQSIISSLNVSQLSITRKCQLQFDEFFSNFTMDRYSWALQSKYRRRIFFLNQFLRSGGCHFQDSVWIVVTEFRRNGRL
jgi:hypothetical protein